MSVSVSVAEASSSYIEKIGEDGNGDLWIKFFLINHERNARGWSIDHRTSKEKVLSAIGKPIVLFRDLLSKKVDHPPWNTKKTAEANYKDQSKYAIGKINKVFYWPDNDSYYATGKITDQAAKDYIKSFKEKKVPLPTSPQLTYDSRKEKPDFYTDWELTHLAIVHKGAYGPDAQVLHVCEGDGIACHNQFQGTSAASASTVSIPVDPLFTSVSGTAPTRVINTYNTSGDGTDFCKTQALKDATASVSTSISQKSDTSQVTQNDNFNSYNTMAEMVEVTNNTKPNSQGVETNRSAVQPENFTFKIPAELQVQQKPFFVNAPSVNDQAIEQAKEIQNQTNNPNKDKNNKKSDNEKQKSDENAEKDEGDEQQGNEQSALKSANERIAELEKSLKQLQKESQDNAVSRRLAEVSNAIPDYLPEFQSKDGKFNAEKYNKTVEEIAQKPYSIEDIHFMYAPRVEAFQQTFNKALKIAPTPEQLAQQALLSAPQAQTAKASAPESNENDTRIFKVPNGDVETATRVKEASVPEYFGIQVPPTGKRPGRIA